MISIDIDINGNVPILKEITIRLAGMKWNIDSNINKNLTYWTIYQNNGPSILTLLLDRHKISWKTNTKEQVADAREIHDLPALEDLLTFIKDNDALFYDPSLEGAVAFDEFFNGDNINPKIQAEPEVEKKREDNPCAEPSLAVGLFYDEFFKKVNEAIKVYDQFEKDYQTIQNITYVYDLSTWSQKLAGKHDAYSEKLKVLVQKKAEELTKQQSKLKTEQEQDDWKDIGMVYAPYIPVYYNNPSYPESGKSNIAGDMFKKLTEKFKDKVIHFPENVGGQALKYNPDIKLSFKNLPKKEWKSETLGTWPDDDDFKKMKSITYLDKMKVPPPYSTDGKPKTYHIVDTVSETGEHKHLKLTPIDFESLKLLASKLCIPIITAEQNQTDQSLAESLKMAELALYQKHFSDSKYMDMIGFYKKVFEGVGVSKKSQPKNL